MGFSLGEKSIKELVGVDPRLVAVVKRAIQLTEQDFSVHDGIRTLAEQKELLRTGATTTLNSRHITGHAVDLVPFINGKLRWEWPPAYKIATAMRKAAKEQGLKLRWGGCWDVDFTNSTTSPETLVAKYVAARKKIGKSAFIDAPHFEVLA
jgi:peptidoglycan LD-endopeptidase CwlK